MTHLNHFYDVMRRINGGVLPLDDDQRCVLEHDFSTPLWVIAGPGTGKTHTLIWLVIKRLVVDEIPPSRIILTTFTRKAAAELESRLLLNRLRLLEHGFDSATAIDTPKMHIGTLHSVCTDILRVERYPETLHTRLLEDELTQQFFIRRSRNPLMRCDDVEFWSAFEMLGRGGYPPNSAGRATHAATLFNRMTENSVDVNALMASDEAHFQRLAEAYQHYQEALLNRNRSDQAHIQRYFLDFLDTTNGQAWLTNGVTVLVDEYQDTNPIQEEIYFRFAGDSSDLTVVGDDDQSLYRFRGATVEALVNFNRACVAFGKPNPKPHYLRNNRRSHHSIVGWVNRFINEHPAMMDDQVQVRAPGKPYLESASSLNGAYRPVMIIEGGSHADAGRKMAGLIYELWRAERVSDLSQIALLTFSTRETSHAIGAYAEALREAGIPFWNPRNQRAHLDETLAGMVGALSWMLDPAFDLDALPRLPGGAVAYLSDARDHYRELHREIRAKHSALDDYVTASQHAIRTAVPDQQGFLVQPIGGQSQRVTLSALFYRLLALEPFSTTLADAGGGERMKALNLILSEFESLYSRGELRLQTSDDGETRIDQWALYNFYGVFVEGIHDGMNEPEDAETGIQPGVVNVMTIHQAKGLEFEVVFVLRPDKQPFRGTAHVLEDVLDPYARRKAKPPMRRSQEDRAAEDAVRLFFVAYSRAKQLLVLTGTNIVSWQRVLGAGYTGTPAQFRQRLTENGALIL